jgi:hypothetical protein
MGIVDDLLKDSIGSIEMLIVLIHNDSTGTDEKANYNVEVRANYQTIFTTRIEGHNRKNGWAALLARVVTAARGVTKSAIPMGNSNSESANRNTGLGGVTES